ncbi:MAG TPA: TIGR03089 family protein [Micromonosporaceae bacterium]|nr:TIGR03089 family protein [Micromonosporaceae bacterium]
MDTISALFTAAVEVDPTRPLLTYYDDATGERTELSGATLANWVAKTANLLVDGVGLVPGDRAAVLLPPHWQTAAVLLGCWSAGVVVDPDPAGSGGGPAEVAFAAADRLAGTDGRAGTDRPAPPGAEIFGLALTPFAMPMRQPPPGVSDFVLEVRGHGDQFRPAYPVLAGSPALPGVSHGELCAAAAARSAALGLATGARVLLDAAATPDPVDWLLAPLAGGASVVLCAHLNPDRLPRRLTDERVTATVGLG